MIQCYSFHKRNFALNVKTMVLSLSVSENYRTGKQNAGGYVQMVSYFKIDHYFSTNHLSGKMGGGRRCMQLKEVFQC